MNKKAWLFFFMFLAFGVSVVTKFYESALFLSLLVLFLSLRSMVCFRPGFDKYRDVKKKYIPSAMEHLSFFFSREISVVLVRARPTGSLADV